MTRYFIHLAYNGKNYHGWQKQPNAHSVQAELESKLEVLLKLKVDVTGCGRTDTGVHARMFFAHFDLPEVADTGKLSFKLNAILPKDIAVYEIFQVEPDLHARFDAIFREYEYQVISKPSPFLGELTYLYTKPISIHAMNEAAELLLSHTDFECFSKVHTDVKTFNCKITYAKWEIQKDGMLIFRIRADRFLRNMVRAIVGTLFEVGKGSIGIKDFNKILTGKNRSEAGQSMPGHALFLTKIGYPFNQE